MRIKKKLDGDKWAASRYSCSTPREIAPGSHLIGASVGPRAGLDAVEERKILPVPGIEPQAPRL
jgi:hypothetical protein